MKPKYNKDIKKITKRKIVEKTISYMNTLLILICFTLILLLIVKNTADIIQTKPYEQNIFK